MDEKEIQGQNGLTGANGIPAAENAGRSTKPENQNQSHNTKKVSLGPNTKR
ncbi:hypothetical protein [Caproiciproducens faecalis]|uniref:Uncharacterized protein n=1 Tax=Caproiciproducens faecalis TaxID=2820301 RepID=A0ABS7DLQ2_9FIRM|nr:hypothetical protein [Caproiciproducens faecalis]MBW7572245.1 hypothetical protein [Caproiciproducens faecalis]